MKNYLKNMKLEQEKNNLSKKHTCHRRQPKEFVPNNRHYLMEFTYTSHTEQAFCYVFTQQNKYAIPPELKSDKRFKQVQFLQNPQNN